MGRGTLVAVDEAAKSELGEEWLTKPKSWEVRWVELGWVRGKEDESWTALAEVVHFQLDRA